MKIKGLGLSSKEKKQDLLNLLDGTDEEFKKIFGGVLANIAIGETRYNLEYFEKKIEEKGIDSSIENINPEILLSIEEVKNKLKNKLKNN